MKHNLVRGVRIDFFKYRLALFHVKKLLLLPLHVRKSEIFLDYGFDAVNSG